MAYKFVTSVVPPFGDPVLAIAALNVNLLSKNDNKMKRCCYKYSKTNLVEKLSEVTFTEFNKNVKIQM